MGIFRKSPGEPLAVTMTGVKLGDRFLSIGLRDTKLIAALAAGAAAAIEREGALVEVTHTPGFSLPFDAGSFDVALVRDLFSAMTPDEKVAVAAEALRVLRGGGRVIVVESTKRTRVNAEALTEPLKAAGFAGVRVLAEAEATIFAEGIKAARTS